MLFECLASQRHILLLAYGTIISVVYIIYFIVIVHNHLLVQANGAVLLRRMLEMHVIGLHLKFIEGRRSILVSLLVDDRS